MARITKQDLMKIQRKGRTVGEIERLAGVEQDEASRREFWIAADDEARIRFAVPYTSAEQVVSVWREKCEEMIAARIQSDALCLI